MTVSTDQRRALERYSAHDARRINNQLRGKAAEEPAVSRLIALIDEVLAVTQSGSARTLYRGIKRPHALELAARGLTTGAIIHFVEFLSMTRDIDIARQFAADDGLVWRVFISESSKALDLVPYSHIPDEEEFLLARNARLRVLGFDGSSSVLDLELIDDG